MMANGVNANQSPAASSPYTTPTGSVHGMGEYGPQPANPWGYPSQMYDPRYGTLARFDPRLGLPFVTNDPRFGIAQIGPGLGIPAIDPRLGVPVPTYDPRFAAPVPTYDPRFAVPASTHAPRFGVPVPTYDPRLDLPMFGWGLDQSAPISDPWLLNGGAMQVQGFGLDGQGFMPWGGFLGLPGRGSEALFGAALSPAGLGFGELSRFGVMGLPKDDEIEEMIHEALDHQPLIPLDADVDVRCESGLVTLTGKVPDKRIKRAAGEAAWWIPGVIDVNNSILVSGRRQTQATRRRGRQQPVQTAR